MTSMPGSLDQSRRQIVRVFAIGVVGSAVLFGVVLLALLFINPNPGFLIILALVVFDIIIGSVALVFQKSRPLWQSILPLAGILSLGVVTAGTLFPDAKTAILPIFIVVVLLISIIGDLRITFTAVVVSGLLTVAMLLAPPVPGYTMSFGGALPFVQMASIISVIVLAWLISERQTAALTATMDLAERRAAEAEAARAEAEHTRAEVEERSTEQQRLLDLVQALEIPIIPIGQGVLVMPLVGSIDSRRVDAIERRLLDAVVQQRAHTVVLDITGISVVDTAVARQLLRTAQAVRLLGARTMLSGISAMVAQTLVTLGVALDDLQPVADLGEALEAARGGDLMVKH